MSEGSERAGRAAAGPVVVARAASTVLLARDRAGLELFLVQRHGSMGFMGGMHVFPGGKVAPTDGSAATLARIRDHATGAQHESWGAAIDRSESVARVVAAIRETFEEAGVLLAVATNHADLAPLRARLLRGEDFAALLAEASLVLELAALTPLIRWITPEREPVRFDTTFYIARAPDDQSACHDEQESIAGAWFSPERALAAAAAGEIRLAPPTEHTLVSLRALDSVDAALAFARGRRAPTVLPIIREEEDGLVLLYPGDPEHPVQIPAFEGPTRRPFRAR